MNYSEANTLLEELNYWVSVGGDPEHPVGDIKSTGESHSRYEYLKNKLQQGNYHIKWENSKYILTQAGDK